MSSRRLGDLWFRHTRVTEPAFRREASMAEYDTGLGGKMQLAVADWRPVTPVSIGLKSAYVTRSLHRLISAALSFLFFTRRTTTEWQC